MLLLLLLLEQAGPGARPSDLKIRICHWTRGSARSIAILSPGQQRAFLSQDSPAFLLGGCTWWHSGGNPGSVLGVCVGSLLARDGCLG